ncbi:MAG: hypothetical protein LBU14_01015 [Candidatus Peribacteria bacterium]|jgi:hypothetical protein|nr:hypothetical protein [Candidatus Peribacteria bacterium]
MKASRVLASKYSFSRQPHFSSHFPRSKYSFNFKVSATFAKFFHLTMALLISVSSHSGFSGKLLNKFSVITNSKTASHKNSNLSLCSGAKYGLSFTIDL